MEWQSTLGTSRLSRQRDVLFTALADQDVMRYDSASGKWKNYALPALTSALIVAALTYTPVPPTRTITAGAGLSGGGDLSANRTLTLALTGAMVNTALGYTAADNAALSAKLAIASNLSDLASASIARTNLGLGTAATSASTAFAASTLTLTAGAGLTGGGDLSANRTLTLALTGAIVNTALGYTAADNASLALKLAIASNLSDLANVVTARTNLGLGTAALSASTAFAASTLTLTAGAGLSGGGDLSANRTLTLALTSGLVTTALGFTPPPNTRTITAGTGLSGGGDLSADRTLTLANTAVAAGAYTSANITVDAQGRITLAANGTAGVTAHSALTGLTTGDDHTQYALLAGRSGGQTLSGGTAASNNLTLQSTSNGTKGYILLGTGGLVGINQATPGAQFHVTSSALGTIAQIIMAAASQTADLLEFQTSTGTCNLRVCADQTLQTMEMVSIGYAPGNNGLACELELRPIVNAGRVKLQMLTNTNADGDNAWWLFGSQTAGSNYGQIVRYSNGTAAPFTGVMHIGNFSKPIWFSTNPNSSIRFDLYVDASGLTGFGTGVPGAQAHILSTSASRIGQIVQSAASQTADMLQLLDSTNAVLHRANKNGYMVTAKNAAPADAELSAGEAAYWFDATNGAAKFMWKGKTLNGTVASGGAQYEIISGTFDGGGAVLTVGSKIRVSVPFAGTITNATALLDQSGSISVEVRKCTYAQFDGGATHPVTGDKISAAAPIAVAAATKSTDSTLTGWTVAVSAGDIVEFYLSSATTATWAFLQLTLTRT